MFSISPTPFLPACKNEKRERPDSLSLFNPKRGTQIRNRSRDYNARFTATHQTVSVYRVLQMRGGGYADVLPVLQVPDNKADAVPCERLHKFFVCAN